MPKGAVDMEDGGSHLFRRPALKDYIRFLSAGCTDDPVSILKIAGVDLSTEKPVEDAMKYFDELLTQLEELAE